MLLDIGLPATGWLGIVIMALLGLLYWLLRNAYNQVIKRIDDLEKNIEDLEKELYKINIEFIQKLSDLKNEMK